MKKIDFSFLVPHFSPRNEKFKKNEKREFLVLGATHIYELRQRATTSNFYETCKKNSSTKTFKTQLNNEHFTMKENRFEYF